MSVPTKTLLDAYALIREITYFDDDGYLVWRKVSNVDFGSLNFSALEVIRKAHASVAKPVRPTTWKPPFCAFEAESDCPVCEASGAVFVRECEWYLDSSDYEAFCDECHAELVVWAVIDPEFEGEEGCVTFTEAEVREPNDQVGT